LVQSSLRLCNVLMPKCPEAAQVRTL